MSGVEIDPGRPVERLPNPYRLESGLMLLAAAVGAVLALTELVAVRQALSLAPRTGAVAALACAGGTLTAAIALAAAALRQLNVERRFRTVAPLDRPKTPGARAIPAQEIIRRVVENDLPPHETGGPFGALLKACLPNLESGSRGLQLMAHANFVNLALILVIAAGLLVSLFLSPAAGANRWIGLIYGAVTLVAIAGALRTGHEIALSGRTFTVLIAVSILTPAALLWLRASAPPIGGFDPVPTVLLALGLFAITCALVLAAIADQIDAAAPTPPAMRTGVWSVNFHPEELAAEFLRAIERDRGPQAWTYAGAEDGVDTSGGAFRILRAQETWPAAVAATIPATVGEFLGRRGYRLLAPLSALNALAWIGAFVAASSLAHAALEGRASVDSLIWLLVLGAVAAHAGRESHALWGRMDYASTLTVIELSGVAERFSASFGNAMTDSVRTDRRSVNIENLQVRFWIADLSSAVLGPLGSRDMVGFSGPVEMADRILTDLRDFSARQAIIVAPTSAEDQRRAASLEAFSRPDAPRFPPGGFGGALE